MLREVSRVCSEYRREKCGRCSPRYIGISEGCVKESNTSGGGQIRVLYCFLPMVFRLYCERCERTCGKRVSMRVP